MDRQTGLILAAVTLVLCACPGVAMCVFGGLFFTVPVNDPGVDANLIAWTGAFLMMCGFGLSLIPVVIGGVFLLRKEDKPLSPAELDEKLPPAI